MEHILCMLIPHDGVCTFMIGGFLFFLSMFFFIQRIELELEFQTMNFVRSNNLSSA